MSGLNLNKKLWRIPQQGMVRGVCAGLAHYLDVPVKLVRLSRWWHTSFCRLCLILCRKANWLQKGHHVVAIFSTRWMLNWPQVKGAFAKWNAT